MVQILLNMKVSSSCHGDVMVMTRRKLFLELVEECSLLYRDTFEVSALQKLQPSIKKL